MIAHAFNPFTLKATVSEVVEAQRCRDRARLQRLLEANASGDRDTVFLIAHELLDDVEPSTLTEEHGS